MPRRNQQYNPTTFPTLKGFVQTPDEAADKEGRTVLYCARGLDDLVTALSVDDNYVVSIRKRQSSGGGYSVTALRILDDGDTVERMLGKVTYRRIVEGPEQGTYWFAESEDADWEVMDMPNIMDDDNWFDYRTLGIAEAPAEAPAPTTNKDVVVDDNPDHAPSEPVHKSTDETIRLIDLCKDVEISYGDAKKWLTANGHGSVHHFAHISIDVAGEMVEALLDS